MKKHIVKNGIGIWLGLRFFSLWLAFIMFIGLWNWGQVEEQIKFQQASSIQSTVNTKSMSIYSMNIINCVVLRFLWWVELRFQFSSHIAYRNLASYFAYFCVSFDNSRPWTFFFPFYFVGQLNSHSAENCLT